MSGTSVKAGDTILERDPWVWAFQWDTYPTLCAGCFLPLEFATRSPLPCSGCHTHHYCSERCKNTDWKMEHKFECTLMKRLADYRQQLVQQPELQKIFQDPRNNTGQPQGGNALLFSVAIILALKVHNKIQKSITDRVPGLDGKRSAREIIQLFDADRSSSQAQQNPEFIKSKTFKGLLTAIYPKLTDRPAEDESADILLRVLHNAHPVWDHNSGGLGPQQYGTGMFLGIEKSHSMPVCLDYNAMAILPGKTLRLVAIDDIPDYRGPSDARWCDPRCDATQLPVKQRRDYFQRKYGRVCGCRKCTDEFASLQGKARHGVSAERHRGLIIEQTPTPKSKTSKGGHHRRADPVGHFTSGFPFGIGLWLGGDGCVRRTEAFWGSLGSISKLHTLHPGNILQVSRYSGPVPSLCWSICDKMGGTHG
ncbi:uncharacterized protein LOC129601676 [Paramacrobiotus metropolitanus]|uniref:uncharacterized protein LOC129601676 n=1 Tax=Paramacrobiotus metropolitanus TaxID=2943436 RepID=UPI00244634F8|nr:uncharacterized protein LOC129601676 [Paramacrobiotus metropolitanus]